MKAAVVIAIGGSLGALSRFWLGRFIQEQAPNAVLPWGTFIVNMLGAFALGFFLTVLSDRVLWAAAVGTGFLGSFTTFSTFAWETINLLRERSFSAAALYASVSLAVAGAAVLAGMVLGSWLQSGRLPGAE
ncbi:MAG: fluoride efflux transporter CrcB [Firmicutes bacterium]|nr:fluoride efflux transporter CrcB [Bacillota bacterium]